MLYQKVLKYINDMLNITYIPTIRYLNIFTVIYVRVLLYII